MISNWPETPPQGRDDAADSGFGHRWLAATSTLIVGIATITLLTRYNMSGTRFAYGFQPSRTWEEYLLVNITGLMLLPFILILGVLRRPAGEFGFRPAEKPGGVIALAFYLLMLPILAIASRQPQFFMYYPMQLQAGEQWTAFFYHQLTYGLYFFCWEFFYRGYLTFGLAKGLGFPIAILLQSIGFAIMHLGKPTPEVYGSFVAGIALGWLAMKSRSFYPCFILHWAISVTFDVLTIQARPGGIF